MHVSKYYCDVCGDEIKEYHCVELVINRRVKIALELCANHFQQLMPMIETYILKEVEAMKK